MKWNLLKRDIIKFFEFVDDFMLWAGAHMDISLGAIILYFINAYLLYLQAARDWQILGYTQNVIYAFLMGFLFLIMELILLFLFFDRYGGKERKR